MKNDHLERVKRLSQALFVSGALNIGLLAAFFYWMVKDRPPTPYCELKPANSKEQQTPLAIDHSNSEIIRSFKRLPLEQLVAKLSNSTQVENGYTQRDLALASLVAFHYFDLDRALLGNQQPAQKRSIPFGKHRDGTIAEITIYPGLSEEQFQAIINFANTEKWPLTSQGLFLMQKNSQEMKDPSLADAFFLTPEFLSVEMLFNRADIPIEKGELLTVLIDGDWQMLATFNAHQRLSQDLSPARRQRFLLDYIDHDSKAAASLMLKTDGAFASKKLEDRQVLGILALLTEKSAESQQFAIDLLTSPRSDAVWQMASQRLYAYAGEPVPENVSHQTVLARFAPDKVVIEKQEASLSKNDSEESHKEAAKVVLAVKPSAVKAVKETIKQPPQKKFRLYIVQEGDSLWKISKRFKVDIEAIRQNNHLDSDFLKPGTTLRIPY